jgi:hypothetical protein
VIARPVVLVEALPATAEARLRRLLPPMATLTLTGGRAVVDDLDLPEAHAVAAALHRAARLGAPRVCWSLAIAVTPDLERIRNAVASTATGRLTVDDPLLGPVEHLLFSTRGHAVRALAQCPGSPPESGEHAE